jgi:ATP-dependent 26S proteasome regulatory subunit
LPGHTTLIITAEQVAFLSVYMNLARLLQPALVVIEDVDLIARDRHEMAGPCEESLLNKLLDEMEGLKEDADILFVLTTNRPEQLEAALAGRPGRVDRRSRRRCPTRSAATSWFGFMAKDSRSIKASWMTPLPEPRASVPPSSRS